MLRDLAERRVPALDRLEQMADDTVQDDQPMGRDLECEPHSDHTNQPQWCLGGLSSSQKRRVQRLYQLEIIEEEQEQTPSKKVVKSQVWRVKPRADDDRDSGSSVALINMVFIMPKEFMAPDMWIKSQSWKKLWCN